MTLTTKPGICRVLWFCKGLKTNVLGLFRKEFPYPAVSDIRRVDFSFVKSF